MGSCYGVNVTVSFSEELITLIGDFCETLMFMIDFKIPVLSFNDSHNEKCLIIDRDNMVVSFGDGAWESFFYKQKEW